jgi:calcineurin-like phosphoesterase family protein
MIFFSADFHLGHINILKYCNRPFKDIDEMNVTIINNWNKIVNNDDLGIILGDIAFHRTNLDLVKKMNGRKWLIRGNHDRGFSDTVFRAVGFERIWKIPQVFKFGGKPFYCMHAPLQYRKGVINLCGHKHNTWRTKDGFINVGVDVNNFAPVSLAKFDLFNIYQ